MARLVTKRSKKAGLPPGALLHIGERKAEQVRITVFDFGGGTFTETVVNNLEDLAPPGADSAVRWILVEGIHNVEMLEAFGRRFEIHPLTLEDILNTDQRPKVEDFGKYTYIVLKMLDRNPADGKIAGEQVSIILQPGLLLSFHESESRIFRPLIERLRKGQGRIRLMGADYLSYCLLDAVVDNFFILLEEMGESVESLEEQISANPRPKTMQAIHGLRRELVQLRRAVWPLREVVNILALGDTPMITEHVKIYLKDVQDHTAQVAETVEIFREMMTEMLTVYLSAVSNRLNEVMKILTIITTIFMPLSLLAGIYGMNFDNMPELHWHWGYPLVLLFMAAIALSMLAWFRVKKWL